MGVDTHCPYCALQCAMRLELVDGAVEVSPRDFPTNRGGLCQKGWTAAEVLSAADRLTHPWIRRGGRLQPASWDEALDLVAATVRDVGGRHGPDAVGVFGGGGLTNEKAYQLGKLARAVLGTRHIDYNGRFCMSAAAAAGNRAFGVDRGLPFPVSDIDGAGAVLLLGSNVADTMPPFVQHLAGARRAGGLLVVDPRRSATAALTDEGAGIHVQPVPGTDQVLLLGLLHLVVRHEHVDIDYVAERTAGFDEVVRSVAGWWPERVAAVTGVPEPVLETVSDVLAAAAPAHGGPGAMVLTGRGVEQHTDGSDTVAAAINLALALGLPGRPRSGFGCLTGQGNGQGGREHGQKSDQLPGYRSIADTAAREHVAGVWGIAAEDLPGPGVPATELLARCGEEVKVLLVHGSNPVVSAPDTVRVRQRLQRLDLLVVSDVVPSETAAIADVVLPVTQWAEEEGTMTNLEGRVLRRRRLLEPPRDVRSELEVWAGLADRLDCSVAMSTDPATVFAELAAASAGGRADYSGLSHALLDADDEGTVDGAGGRYWPAPTPTSTTPRMFGSGFAHPDRRARFRATSPRGHAEPTKHSPVHLVTGRVLAQYQSGAQTRRVASLAAAAPGPLLEIHPRLAGLVGVHDGDKVRVTSTRGQLDVPARVTLGIRPDTVFLAFHWAESANVLVGVETDPVCGMPALKVVAVSLERTPLAVPSLEPVAAPA